MMEDLMMSPTLEDQRIVSMNMDRIIDEMAYVRSLRTNLVRIKISDSDQTINLPKAAVDLLFKIIATIADGRSISLLASSAVLSTQQGAEILNISRPHFVKLLERGEMPFTKIGKHRKVKLEDVLNYQKEHTSRQHKAIERMQEMAQEYDMGY